MLGCMYICNKWGGWFQSEKKEASSGTSMVVGWLGLRIAGGSGSIPGQGTMILHASAAGPQNKQRSVPSVP